jgi:Protein of unknown function (DUF4019)
MIQLSIALGAALAAVTPQRQQAPSYALLTLPSGHVFRVLSSGPVLGPSGKRLALGISYQSFATSRKELYAEAEEMFQYLRPHAEHENDTAVMVIARFGSGTGTVDLDSLYERQKSGKWKRVARADKPLPSTEAKPAEEERDLAGTRAAKEKADAWLSLLDGAEFAESWDAAAPLLREQTSRDSWTNSVGSIRAAVGRPHRRKLISLMETRTIPSGPEGRYVVLEYSSSFERKGEAFETVTQMLCDDGEWRVAGYALR